jgi:hypothetical protein
VGNVIPIRPLHRIPRIVDGEFIDRMRADLIASTKPWGKSAKFVAVDARYWVYQEVAS